MLTKKEFQSIRERYENASEGAWKIGKRSPSGAYNVGTYNGLLTAQTTDEANAIFIANAKKDVLKLMNEVENLCPIGDLDTISSLQAENNYLTEVIAEKDEVIKSLVDDTQKIRAVVKDY